MIVVLSQDHTPRIGSRVSTPHAFGSTKGKVATAPMKAGSAGNVWEPQIATFRRGYTSPGFSSKEEVLTSRQENRQHRLFMRVCVVICTFSGLKRCFVATKQETNPGWSQKQSPSSLGAAWGRLHREPDVTRSNRQQLLLWVRYAGDSQRGCTFRLADRAHQHLGNHTRHTDGR